MVKPELYHGKHFMMESMKACLDETDNQAFEEKQMTAFQDAVNDLVVANRILAKENVVDAFGHASIRHPERPDVFIMSYSRSPELVEVTDLGEFRLDGAPLKEDNRKPYIERFIHAGIYEARADVHAVIHNHSHAIIPFSVTGVPLRPLGHTCATMGGHVPVWDIADRFGETDMLVVNMEQARDLAASLGGNTSALMRGHGCVVVGPNIRSAVISAVYLQVNANLQMNAMRLGDVHFLSAEEARLAETKNLSPLIVDRVWEHHAARVAPV